MWLCRVQCTAHGEKKEEEEEEENERSPCWLNGATQTPFFHLLCLYLYFFLFLSTDEKGGVSRVIYFCEWRSRFSSSSSCVSSSSSFEAATGREMTGGRHFCKEERKKERETHTHTHACIHFILSSPVLTAVCLCRHHYMYCVRSVVGIRQRSKNDYKDRRERENLSGRDRSGYAPRLLETLGRKKERKKKKKKKKMEKMKPFPREKKELSLYT